MKDVLKNSIFMFVTVFLIVYFIKPKVFFQDDKNTRQFGVGYSRDKEKKTLFSLSIVVPILAIFSLLVNYAFAKA